MREDNELYHFFAEIKGHPNYGVNALGEIKNLKTGRILKPYESHRGYQKVELDGKKYYIHRLVAETLIRNEEHKRFVVHKNGDKSDNYFANLMWTSDYKRR